MKLKYLLLCTFLLIANNQIFAKPHRNTNAPANLGCGVQEKPTLFGAVRKAGITPPAGWAIGNKKILDIRVQFPDLASQTTQNGDLTILNSVNQRTQNCSYGQKSYTITVTSQIYTLPHNSTFYENGAYVQLGADARQAVLADFGDVHANYDRVIYHFPNDPPIILGKQGYSIIGGQDVWMSGGLTETLVMHEEGHNDGLHHAHRWVPTDLNNPADPNGTFLDYGDYFDIMGNNGVVATDFNPYEKIAIEWLNSSKVAQATSGTHRYRIYRFDSPSANNSVLLGINFPRVSPANPSYKYWVSYRGNTFTGAPTNGAYIQWGLNPDTTANPNTYLIDRVPNTDWKDAIWTVGSTFNDTPNGITIKPIQTGGTAPNLWIDVDVTLP